MSPETAATQSPWTVGRLLAWTTGHFQAHGVDEPRLAAEILLAHAIGCERIGLYTRFDEQPANDALNTFRELVRRGASGTPVAYLVGYKEFFSLTFEVTADVLIPRPETETLVERAVDACKALSDPEPADGRDAGARKCEATADAGAADRATPVHVLDLGTGSGCVIVAIVSQLPRALGTATDISPAALEVARRNADRHGVADRIVFIEADRLDLPAEATPTGGFDLIVSNPPYISQADLSTVAPSVRDHEPVIALTPGGDGLDFYRAIATDAPRLLRPAGIVLVEIGAGQAAAVESVFRQCGCFEHVGTFRGRGDPHDRVMQFAKV